MHEFAVCMHIEVLSFLLSCPFSTNLSMVKITCEKSSEMCIYLRQFNHPEVIVWLTEH